MSDEETLTSTTQLLSRYRAGEESAANGLFERYMPILRRWARGRLPAYGRDLSETEDLLQLTFLRALKRLDKFESERPGSFLAYLRAILLNLVREELRRNARRPSTVSMIESLPGQQISQVEQTIGRERLEVYEKALSQLSEVKRNAVIMRVEFGMTFPEIARELERPSANATRMMISRALDELAALIES
ncbi:MAG: sigma-70 family RNA polymerase sigma factor [Xanthomonadales bacterium]|nr:sigma-70 family RNA polymerase sigma factor [Xanthomonadales bacterium]